jgi:hypothetical protein
MKTPTKANRQVIKPKRPIKGLILKIRSFAGIGKNLNGEFEENISPPTTPLNTVTIASIQCPDAPKKSEKMNINYSHLTPRKLF